jgi:hypothetical protein
MGCSSPTQRLRGNPSGDRSRLLPEIQKSQSRVKLPFPRPWDRLVQQKALATLTARRGVSKKFLSFDRSKILPKATEVTLQRFNPSTLQRFNASTLQRFNASTLQPFNTLTM